MRSMAEPDIRRNLVYAHPRYRSIGLCKGGQLLYRRFVGADGRMALHTNRCRRYSHFLARIGIQMTIAAFQIQFSGVQFVTVRYRLLRRRRGLLLGLRRDYKQTRRQETYREKRLHRVYRSPLRIRSAKYSDARIDNAIIVIVGF